MADPMTRIQQRLERFRGLPDREKRNALFAMSGIDPEVRDVLIKAGINSLLSDDPDVRVRKRARELYLDKEDKPVKRVRLSRVTHSFNRDD